MHEIVSIGVGQCGHQIGTRFWEEICVEHGVDPVGFVIGSPDNQQQSKLQSKGLHVFFNEAKDGRRMARAVFVDPDKSASESVRSSFIGELFSPDHFVTGQAGAGGNWAKGHSTEESELIESALHVIRQQAEACDHLEGFQMTHSLGGKTGSRLGTLLISKLKEEYPDRMVYTFSVFPSPKVSDSVVEPYNATLAMHQLIENPDLVIALDNEALYDVCFRTLMRSSPRYSDLNQLVASAMSGATYGLRFPSLDQLELSSTLRRLVANTVPYPRLHFLMTSLAPLTWQHEDQLPSREDQPPSLEDLTTQAFDPRNLLCAADTTQGKYLTALCNFKGYCDPTTVLPAMDSSMQKLTARLTQQNQVVEWIPNNIRAQIYPQSAKYQTSCTMLCNSTAIQDMIKRIRMQFVDMFRRKAFLHWFTAEGVDEGEFTEADSDIVDLIDGYHQQQTQTEATDKTNDGKGESSPRRRRDR